MKPWTSRPDRCVFCGITALDAELKPCDACGVAYCDGELCIEYHRVMHQTDQVANLPS